MKIAHEQPENSGRYRRLNRRQLLRVGGLGSLGLTLPGLLRAEAEGPVARGTKAPGVASPIRSCILIFHYGGPSHIDTFDMKPKHRRDPWPVRLDRDQRTRVAGLRALASDGEGDGPPGNRPQHAPSDDESQCGGVRDLVRSRSAQGRLELLSNDRNDPPCYGAILSATLPERRGLPTFVALPHVMYNVVQLPGQVAGFLGSAHDPFQVSADPSTA